MLRLTAFLILMISLGAAHATIYILDDHVEQQAELTVLGKSYSQAYSGAVAGTDPSNRQNISLLFEEDAMGNEIFTGISTDLEPGTQSFFYGLVESQSYSPGNYSFHLNSDIWVTQSSPEADMAVDTHTQNSYIDFTLRFMVDGAGGTISMYGQAENPYAATPDVLLFDETAGTVVISNEAYDFALEDGHTYVASAVLTNTAFGEHSVWGDIWFRGDTVVAPSPSILMLLSTGLVFIGAMRGMVQKRS
ncbi:MAG: hypothetical protein PVF13_02810 [Chromatiales bacterium]|jgi:hypothetical protein